MKKKEENNMGTTKTKGGIMKEKAVLVDIDGTLVEITPNWTKERDDIWVEETMNAVAYKFAVELVKKYKKMGYKIVIVTARGQSCKVNTVKKLKEIGVYELVDTMMHRVSSYENTKNAVWKKAAIKMLRQRYNFVYALEDEDANMEVMQQQGMTIVDARIWH